MLEFCTHLHYSFFFFVICSIIIHYLSEFLSCRRRCALSVVLWKDISAKVDMLWPRLTSAQTPSMRTRSLNYASIPDHKIESNDTRNSFHGSHTKGLVLCFKKTLILSTFINTFWLFFDPCCVSADIFETLMVSWPMFFPADSARLLCLIG